MRTERVSSVGNGLRIGVQVTLRRGQRAVPSDLAEHMDRNACISHPGQAGMPEIVAAQVWVAELGDYLVPVRCIAQHRSGNAPATRGR